MTLVYDTGRGGSAGTVESLHVLVIEDDDAFVEVAKLLLGQVGLGAGRTSVLGTLAEVEQLLRLEEVDLILADLSLPDAHGLEVIEYCCTQAPGVPVIVLTACRDIGLAQAALAQGAQDYLVKGEFDEQDLERAIRHARARARSEEQLRRALRELEDSNRQLEEYATIASHDLRSPVRTARVLLGRMLESPALRSDALTGQLGGVLDACLERLHTMLEGLFEYAHARDLSSSGERVDELFSMLARELILDLDADLREVGVVIEVQGDAMLRTHPILVRSLLSNLVRNAVKYRSDHPLKVVLGVEPAGDGVVLVRVSDNGIGIEPKHRQRVFGMFERLSSHGDGIGLGLTLCHRIVSLHGGEIWIEDGLDGGGITVSSILPVAS